MGSFIIPIAIPIHNPDAEGGFQQEFELTFPWWRRFGEFLSRNSWVQKAMECLSLAPWPLERGSLGRRPRHWSLRKNISSKEAQPEFWWQKCERILTFCFPCLVKTWKHYWQTALFVPNAASPAQVELHRPVTALQLYQQYCLYMSQDSNPKALIKMQHILTEKFAIGCFHSHPLFQNHPFPATITIHNEEKCRNYLSLNNRKYLKHFYLPLHSPHNETNPLWITGEPQSCMKNLSSVSIKRSLLGLTCLAAECFRFVILPVERFKG